MKVLSIKSFQIGKTCQNLIKDYKRCIDCLNLVVLESGPKL